MQLHKQKDENYGYQIVGTDWKDIWAKHCKTNTL